VDFSVGGEHGFLFTLLQDSTTAFSATINDQDEWLKYFT